MNDYNHHIRRYRDNDGQDEMEMRNRRREYRRENRYDDWFPFRFDIGFGLDLERRNNQPEGPVINEGDYHYTLPLIPGSLEMDVYDEGIGLHPSPGKFIFVRQRIYLEGEEESLRIGVASYLYGRKRILPGLQLAFSLIKERMKCRLKMASHLGYGDVRTGTVPPNSTLFIDFTVISIESFPSDDDQQLEQTYCEIVNCSSEGDREFQNKNYQLALMHYQQTQYKIHSDRFTKALKDARSTDGKKPPKKPDSLTSMIEDEVQKICLKALEVALINDEYFKVIKWGYPLLINPKYERSERGLMARARAYIEINQFDMAMKDLKKIKLVNPEYEPVHKEIEYMEKKKKIYEEQKEQWAMYGEVEQEDFAKLNEKKQKTSFFDFF